MEDRICTGTEVLDTLLEGGYEKDAITTIYGPAGVGKTNFALLAALETAKKKKVIYIDTEGGFSAARLKQLEPDHKKAMKNIVFLRPTTFEDQNKSINKLRTLITNKIGLIIVDTIGMLYRFERSKEEFQEFNRDLGLQMRTLNEICRKQKIPVLITNQVYQSFNDGQVHVIGGDIIKYASKCLIELQQKASKRKAIVRKHRSIAGEKESFFQIVEKGIEKA